MGFILILYFVFGLQILPVITSFLALHLMETSTYWKVSTYWFYNSLFLCFVFGDIDNNIEVHGGFILVLETYFYLYEMLEQDRQMNLIWEMV
jgi:hypothetical protein